MGRLRLSVRCFVTPAIWTARCSTCVLNRWVGFGCVATLGRGDDLGLFLRGRVAGIPGVSDYALFMQRSEVGIIYET